MPIEFRCTHCDRLLRTPDGTSGKDAKCPQCGALVKIPDQAPQSSAPPPPAPEYRPQVESGNPFQSPGAATMAAGPQGDIRRGFQPARIDLGDMLSRTWQIFKANLWPCVGAAALLLIISAAAGVGVNLLFPGRRPTLNGGLVRFVLGIVQFWITLGLMTYFLKVARGERAELRDLFSAGPLLLPAFGLSILYSLMVLVGFILLIIPGIVISIMFSPCLLVLLDQKSGVFQSLELARQATSGNKLTLLALYLIMTFGGALFVLLTCGLGYFFFQPFALLLLCVSYLSMTGQTTAEQRYAQAF